MLALLGISTLASLIASSALAIRLLRLARRTGEVPELLMGGAFLAAGVIGYVLLLIGTGGAQAMPAETARLFFLAGYAAISGGVILTYLFVWRVFRPASRVARVFVGIVCPTVAVTGLPFALPTLDAPGAPIEGVEFAVFWLGHTVRVACGAWGALEAGHYYLVMRRRMRLDLADPVVTNRIALWGLASLGSVVIFASTALSNASSTSMDEIMSPAQILLISSVTFGVATCQWLAFLAPRWYIVWVRGGAAQRAWDPQLAAAPPNESPRA
jgi:hypothetical protein